MHNPYFLALAAAATALPQKRALSNQEFTLAIQTMTGNDRVPLTAVRNGTDTYYLLVAQSPGSAAATPAFANGTHAARALALDIDGQPVYMFASDIGDLRGADSPVTAEYSHQQEEWYIHKDDDRISREVSAGNNLMLACQRPVNGVEVSVLAWGSEESDGSLPGGCYATGLYKKCNIAGSTATCKDSL